MATQESNTITFDEFLEKSDVPVLVDFWAEWCGPCRLMHPILQRIAKKLSGQIKVIKVNVDKKPQIASRFQILSIPTLVLFKNNEPIWRTAGVMPENQLVRELERVLNSDGSKHA
ncbi:MAG TPA: thioredoxin [Balneolales bacterium]|nr:thioredoxin [Balneolales bacterium]